MAEELLNAAPDRIEELTLVPSSGGVFHVDVDGKRIFSNQETGRFPEKGEIPRLFSNS